MELSDSKPLIAMKNRASEFQKGMEEEAVHPVGATTRKAIVQDHLKEKADYYTAMARCMDKSSNCSSHDPNTPESFDNRQKPLVAKKRLKGFVLAAKKAGLTPGQTLDFLHKSAALGDQINSTLEGLPPQLGQLNTNASAAVDQLKQLLGLSQKTLATAGGALAGGGLGYLSGGADEEASKRRAILGGLAGGASGFGLSQL